MVKVLNICSTFSLVFIPNNLYTGAARATSGFHKRVHSHIAAQVGSQLLGLSGLQVSFQLGHADMWQKETSIIHNFSESNMTTLTL